MNKSNYKDNDGFKPDYVIMWWFICLGISIGFIAGALVTWIYQPYLQFGRPIGYSYLPIMLEGSVRGVVISALYTLTIVALYWSVPSPLKKMLKAAFLALFVSICCASVLGSLSGFFAAFFPDSACRMISLGFNITKVGRFFFAFLGGSIWGWLVSPFIAIPFLYWHKVRHRDTK